MIAPRTPPPRLDLSPPDRATVPSHGVDRGSGFEERATTMGMNTMMGMTQQGFQHGIGTKERKRIQQRIIQIQPASRHLTQILIVTNPTNPTRLTRLTTDLRTHLIRTHLTRRPRQMSAVLLLQLHPSHREPPSLSLSMHVCRSRTRGR